MSSTVYVPVKLHFTAGQKAKLKHAIATRSEVTLRFSHAALSGFHATFVTKGQANRIQKAKAGGTGVQIRFSPTQLKHNVQHGSGIFGDLARAVAAPVIDHGIDFLAGAAKSAAKGLIGAGAVKPKRPRKKKIGKGFFGDALRRGASSVIDAGVDLASNAVKSGAKGLIGAGTGAKRGRKKKGEGQVAGGITAPGMHY